MLLTGKLAGGAMQYNLLRMFNLKRRLNIPQWPVTQATVSQATRTRYQYFLNYRWFPDKIDVACVYEVAGTRYENCFTVFYRPVDGYWAGLATNVSIGEKVMIRYDPDNPSDFIPVEKTWHGWTARTLVESSPIRT